jgi:hypothetical protein
MSFCTACGGQRTGASHYCDGCGAEFVAETGSGAREGGWAAPWSPDPSASQPHSATVTRPDLGIGLLDSLLTAPDPSWDDWYVRPSAEAPDPVRRPAGSRRPKRMIVAVVAAVVAVALSGAAVFELDHGHAPPGARAAAGGSGAASVSGTPRPAASLPPGGVSDVAVAPTLAGNAALSRVMALLHRYFSAINQHDYAAYARLLDPRVLVRTPASAFYSGYASTIDSDETLAGISATDSGGVAAAITFTSHQQPSASPDHSTCDNWSITLYLVPEGAGYLIAPPPSGYQASYVSC